MVRRGILGILLLVIVVGLAWWWLRPTNQISVRAAEANTRGIGWMEQFQYGPAAEAFEEARTADPHWPAAKINLALALLNTQTPANLDRALDLFAEVLRTEPDHPHANYGRGIILYYRNELEEAHAHFRRVTDRDPQDAHARYFLGRTRPDEPLNPDSKADYELALKLNPYLNAARYAVAQHVHDRNIERSRTLLAEHKQLIDANWESETEIKYTMMGRYAEVIGRRPRLASNGPGPWPMFAAAPVTVPETPTLPAVPAVLALHSRFGQAPILWDFNADARPDLILAVPGGLQFYRATAAGFQHHTSFPNCAGASIADFDNDGDPDMLLTGPHGLQLFRNDNGTTLTDVTTLAGLDTHRTPTTTALWLDLDQDGDLDIVIAGEKLQGFLNAGVAAPSDVNQPVPALSAKFLPMESLTQAVPAGPLASLLATDLDHDDDVDLVLFRDGQSPQVILNDRLLRFRRGDDLPAPPATWLGGLVFDADGDDYFDLLLLPQGAPPLLLPGVDPHSLMPRKVVNLPSLPLKQAIVADLDLDGHSDIVGITAGEQPITLRGQGDGHFLTLAEPFGAQQLTRGL
ncbi:MAG: FG-GAP-like repeat-containing protein, partial [Gemmataceae bacterium]